MHTQKKKTGPLWFKVLNPASKIHLLFSGNKNKLKNEVNTVQKKTLFIL